MAQVEKLGIQGGMLIGWRIRNQMKSWELMIQAFITTDSFTLPIFNSGRHIVLLSPAIHSVFFCCCCLIRLKVSRDTPRKEASICNGTRLYICGHMLTKLLYLSSVVSLILLRILFWVTSKFLLSNFSLSFLNRGIVSHKASNLSFSISNSSLSSNASILNLEGSPE